MGLDCERPKHIRPGGPLVKLHIGSGSHYADGWLNVDCDPQWRVDILAKAEALPAYYGRGTFTHVYMGHFLEHIDFDHIPTVIEHILYSCTPDVQVAVVGPCLDLATATGQDEGLLAAIRYQGKTGPGEHAWTATTDLTRQALTESGLNAIQVPVNTITKPAWPNPSTAEWQCAFLATRAA